jgi:DNA-binding MarR family transcriptional regulator
MATGDSATDLNVEILDCMAELVASMLTRAEEVAQQYGVPIFFLKVFHRLDCPMAMKELGQRMRCDPSFVTMIADVLEQRGLAKREPNAVDRRVKNLVLTDRGLEVKAAMEQETLGLMPWTQALDRGEREQFLELLRKMCKALAAAPVSPAVGQPEREVNSATGLTSSVAP